MTEISIIILNYKSARLTRQCIKGIKRFPPKAPYEIIVVDNNSKDGAGEMLKEKYPEVIFIGSKINRGYGAGMNLGIAKAKGEYILILNPDIVILENSIESLYEFMKEHPDAGIAGPKLLNPDKTTQSSYFRFHTILTPLYRRTPLGKLPWAKEHLSRFLMAENQTNGRPRTVEWLLGACMMARKSVLQKIGMFDERFFLYFEDTDLCRRAWEGGFKVYYASDSRMVHYHMRESAEYSGLMSILSYPTRVHIKSWIKYILKYKDKQIPKIN